MPACLPVQMAGHLLGRVLRQYPEAALQRITFTGQHWLSGWAAKVRGRAKGVAGRERGGCYVMGFWGLNEDPVQAGCASSRACTSVSPPLPHPTPTPPYVPM